MMIEICGITPEAIVFSRKISPYLIVKVIYGLWIFHLAVFSECDNALLNSSTTGIEHSNQRDTGLDCQFHDLDDLVSRGLTKRATKDCEVLRVNRNLTAVNGSNTGDH